MTPKRILLIEAYTCSIDDSLTAVPDTESLESVPFSSFEVRELNVFAILEKNPRTPPPFALISLGNENVHATINPSPISAMDHTPVRTDSYEMSALRPPRMMPMV
jgi:hypothetical protein